MGATRRADGRGRQACRQAALPASASRLRATKCGCTSAAAPLGGAYAASDCTCAVKASKGHLGVRCPQNHRFCYSCMLAVAEPSLQVAAHQKPATTQQAAVACRESEAAARAQAAIKMQAAHRGRASRRASSGASDRVSRTGARRNRISNSVKKVGEELTTSIPQMMLSGERMK